MELTGERLEEMKTPEIWVAFFWNRERVVFVCLFVLLSHRS